MPILLDCARCGSRFQAQRRTAKYCSDRCAQRNRSGTPLVRGCKRCGIEFKVVARGDSNRQYCSRTCSRAGYREGEKFWRSQHPDAWKIWNENRRAKNPGANVEAKRAQREETLRLLGGKCLACGVDNPVWLEVDYIPTTRGRPFRHERGMNFIRANLHDFRLLCANHHREVTLTGKIEGTDITQ